MTIDRSIEERIISGLAKIKKKKPESIPMQARLIEDLEIDSLDTLDLVFQLEEEFAIEIPAEHQLQFATVADVIRYVERRVGHAATTSA